MTNTQIQLTYVTDEEYARIVRNQELRAGLTKLLHKFKKDCRDDKIKLDLKTKLAILTNYKELIEATYE